MTCSKCVIQVLTRGPMTVMVLPIPCWICDDLKLLQRFEMYFQILVVIPSAGIGLPSLEIRDEEGIWDQSA